MQSYADVLTMQPLPGTARTPSCNRSFVNRRFCASVLLVAAATGVLSCEQTTLERPTGVDSSTSHDPAQRRRATNIARLVALASECAKRPPRLGLGKAGTPLVFDRYVSLRPSSSSTWIVQFTEQNPPTSPYGLELAIDIQHELCDSKPIALTAAPKHAIDADAVLTRARTCAGNGIGVGGSALRFDSPVIRYSGPLTALVVHFPEVSPKGAPSGRDIGVSADASHCAPEVMD